MTDSNTQDPVIPQDQQVVSDPGYSYKEIHTQPAAIIAATPEPEAGTPVVEPKKEEEIPLEQVGKNIAEETARKILDEQRLEKERLAEEARAKEESTKPALDPKAEYQLIADEIAKEKGRNPTWEEIAVKMEERTIDKVEQRQQEKIKQQEEEAKRIQEQQALEDKTLLDRVNDELSELYKANKLTPIKDPKNPSDPGVIEQNALYDKWREVNTQRQREGKRLIDSAIHIYEFYYEKPKTQVAGADAPIAGNRSSTITPGDEKSYTYADLKKPWNYFKQK